MSWSSLDQATKDQMSCTFAALFLHDEGVEVNAANLNKVLTATNNKVAGYWPMLFANALAGRSVGEFLAVRLDWRLVLMQVRQRVLSAVVVRVVAGHRCLQRR